MSTRRWALSVLLILALLIPGASASLAQPAASQTAATPSTYGGSMLIVENAGQWPAAARFQVWNSPLGAGTTWLSKDAIWLVITADDKVARWQGDWEPSRRDKVTGYDPTVTLSPPRPVTLSSQIAMKLTFPGSNPDVRIEPFDPLTTTVSYFIGNDPDQWRPVVPVWGGVRYVDLYPGVDLVLGGRDRAWRLEAASGAAVEQVHVQIEGAPLATLDGATLELDGANEPLPIALPSAPFAYQFAGLSRQGDTPALTVHSGLRSARSPRPDDNPADLLYGTFLGGSDWDLAIAVDVDGTGNSYVTGYIRSSDFPTTPGAFDPSFNGAVCGTPPATYPCYDIFAAKLNPTGSALVYATFLGGGWDEWGYDIALDGVGSAYVTGFTRSSDFPTTPDAFDPTFGGGTCGTPPNTYRCSDAFAVKLNPTGSALAYATYLGSSNSDNGSGIAVDEMGRAYIGGDTASSNFPTTPGAFDPSYSGNGEAFIVKFNQAGSGLDYATFLGGSGGDGSSDIAVDGAGNAYVCGSTTSSNFPTTPGAFNSILIGYDFFAAKLNSTGSGLIYATFLSRIPAHKIAIDGAGSAYVTGYTTSSNLPTTPGAFDTTFGGGTCGTPPNTYPCTDAFVAKLNPTGRALAFATYLGSGGMEFPGGIDVDGEGSASVTGETESSDFPTTPGAFDTTFNRYYDAFVVRFNPAGSGLDYATFLGGANHENGLGIAVDNMGSTYVTGAAYSDFPTTPGAFDPSHNGSSDAFVTKLNTLLYSPDVLAPIEQPLAGAFVSGAVTLRGYAIDRASPTGAGIDIVHIYLDGPYGTGTIIGGATYGLERPDVAAQYGERFRFSGWELAWDTHSLAPGMHWLYLYAHRTTDGGWSVMAPHLVLVPGGPMRWLPLVLRQR